MKAWLASPTHKKNILNPKFKEIGVAVKTANFEGHESILVVQIFGTPTSISATSKAQLQNNESFSLQNANTNQNTQERLLTNSAPQTLLVTNTNSKVNTSPSYLNKANLLYGQEYLSLEFVEEAILYIVDYGNTYLMNYYFTIIIMLLLVFSASFIRQKKNI